MARRHRLAGAFLSVILCILPCTVTLAQPPPPPSQPRTPLTLAQLLSPQSQFPLPPPPKTFRCENWQFASEVIPLSFVVDGVCDCCDGSDERVKGGQNPFFVKPTLDSPAASTEKAEQKPASTGGGWLSSLLGGSDSDSDSESDLSPCPNTCASVASRFLTEFEQKVNAYERAVARKQSMVKTLPPMLKKLQSELAFHSKNLEAAAERYNKLRALHESNPTPEIAGAFEQAASHANLVQWHVENTRWLLGLPVPHPRNRQMQRPPGYFGKSKEFLLLNHRCFDSAWPQRRFGSHGEQMFDWYLMQLCPLQNATQQAMTRIPKLEGAKWREGGFEEGDGVKKELAVADQPWNPSDMTESELLAAAQFGVNVPTPKQPAEPPPVYVLGYWTGELLSKVQIDEQKKQAAAEEQAALTAAAAGPGGKKSPPPPYVAPSSLTPKHSPGSVLASLSPPEYHSFLRGGQDCWQVGPRQADLVLECGEEEEITAVRENGKCRYEFRLQTPLACDKDHLNQLTKQLEDYKRWFARPQPKKKEAQTLQQLLHHDEL